MLSTIASVKLSRTSSCSGLNADFTSKGSPTTSIFLNSVSNFFFIAPKAPVAHV